MARARDKSTSAEKSAAQPPKAAADEAEATGSAGAHLETLRLSAAELGVAEPAPPGESTPHHDPTPGPPVRSGADSPTTTTLFGLVVVWGAFYLMAIAQNISNNEMTLGFSRALDSGGEAWRRERFLAAMDVHSIAMLPIDTLNIVRMSPRQITRQLLRHARIGFSEDELELISDEPTNISLAREPFHRVLHAVIDDSKIGYALQSRRIRFFPQKLENAEPTGGPYRQFQWEAILELSPEKTVVFPSNQTDLWLFLSLRLPSRGGVLGEPILAVEIWRDSEQISAGEGALGEDNRAMLSFSSGGAMVVNVEGLESLEGQNSAAVSTGLKYKVRIFYQERTESEPGAAGDSSRPV